MNTVKGFIVIEPYIDNEVGVISQLGEISTWSLTYTKERGTYKDPMYPDLHIEGLSSRDSNGQLIELTQESVSNILAVIKKVIDFTKTYATNLDTNDLIFYIESIFNGSNRSTACGPLITTTYASLPSYIQWYNVTSDTFVKLWFSDTEFRNDFDDYSITVVPPFDNIDDFFNSSADVIDRLNKFKLSEFLSRVETFKSYNPETYIRTIDAEFHPEHSSLPVVMTHWGAIIHGQSGDNVDSIKDAIINYILEYSERPQQDWVAILPELFERTEFIFVPLWDREAIPNMTIQSGVYSSITRYKEDFDKGYLNIPFYSRDHFYKNACSTVLDYRSLSTVLVGGEYNKDKRYNITDFLPDLIFVPTTSLDFARMSQGTQEFVNLLEGAVMSAEKSGELNSVYLPYRKAYRSNKVYIAFMFNNVQYLVITKSSMS